jgi:hypothetical protein
MYHLNPAVIKSILFGMPKEEFMRHARYIGVQRFVLGPGNRKRMFSELFLWCQRHYRRE